MLKKLVVGGIISMFMMVTAIPSFAATSCPYSTNTANASQIAKSCNNNTQLASLLKQLKAGKCSNNKNIQALLNKLNACKSTNSVKSCSTANNCATIRCSNGKCYTINCSTGSCLTNSCPANSLLKGLCQTGSCR
ncbi:MAG: hypothetical protein ACM3UU_10635 [Ignavibacteriales bacterium]